jgi:two-component system OmpR family response regulator
LDNLKKVSVMHEILMVEDDAEMITLLERYLSGYGFNIFSLVSPLSAIDKLQTQHFDLVLLDLSLPDMDGLELCKMIKENYPLLPVIISTARSDVTDKVIGFESGADDYIAKPYDPRELVARIQYHIKRSKNIISVAKPLFYIDEKRFKIFKDDLLIDLTMAEYEVFALLLKHKDMVISREFIVNSVNSIQWESSDHSINVIVGRIRQKIGDSVKEPKFIKSIRGVGYQYIGD